VRSPNAKPAEVGERACGLLALQQLDCTGVRALAETSLARRGAMPLGEQLAPHFARRAIDPPARACRRARSTRACSASRSTELRRQLAELAGRNVEDGAVVVLDNASGEVLALGRLERRALERGRGRRRPRAAPAGLDAEAVRLRARVRAAADHAGDADRRLAGADRDRRGPVPAAELRPRWHGFVSARTALGASLNVPAVRVGAMVGSDALLAASTRSGSRCRKAPAGTARRSRSAAPTSRCSR
jgi:penicillin-binding protein 1C